MWVYSQRRSCPAAALGCSYTAPAPGGCSASPSLFSHSADGGPRAETVCLHTVNTQKIVCSLALQEALLYVSVCMGIWFFNLHVPMSSVCVCTSFCSVCVWACAWSNWLFSLLASCRCWFSREPSLSCRTSSLFSRDSKLLLRTWLCSLVLQAQARTRTDTQIDDTILSSAGGFNIFKSNEHRMISIYMYHSALLCAAVCKCLYLLIRCLYI